MSEAKREPDVPTTVRELYEARAKRLQFELMAGASGLHNVITSPRIQKLGLALSGHIDYLHSGRIQFIGRTEGDYLKTLKPEQRRRALERIFSLKLTCIIITMGLAAPEELLALSRRHRVPVLRTDSLSSRAIDEVTGFLEERLAPSTTIHATFMEVFGLGVLITGDSGVGKSECALDLILRGHRLVSDDLVVVKRHGLDRLVGSGPDQLAFHMELRGLGIINIRDLFGISAVSAGRDIDLVISLERWRRDAEYDRLGVDERFYRLLDVPIPLITMPVASGRNLATLVEVAIRIQLLRKQGYRPASDFFRTLEEKLSHAQDEEKD